MSAIEMLGGVKMTEFFNAVSGNLPFVEQHLELKFKPLGSGAALRRLSVFADKEGKTRIIAILDYFSQTVLKGLHSYLFKALKKIPQDMTFNQGAFKDKIKG